MTSQLQADTRLQFYDLTELVDLIYGNQDDGIKGCGPEDTETVQGWLDAALADPDGPPAGLVPSIAHFLARVPELARLHVALALAKYGQEKRVGSKDVFVSRSTVEYALEVASGFFGHLSPPEVESC